MRQIPPWLIELVEQYQGSYNFIAFNCVFSYHCTMCSKCHAVDEEAKVHLGKFDQFLVWAFQLLNGFDGNEAEFPHTIPS